MKLTSVSLAPKFMFFAKYIKKQRKKINFGASQSESLNKNPLLLKSTIVLKILHLKITPFLPQNCLFTIYFWAQFLFENTKNTLPFMFSKRNFPVNSSVKRYFYKFTRKSAGYVWLWMLLNLVVSKQQFQLWVYTPTVVK